MTLAAPAVASCDALVCGPRQDPPSVDICDNLVIDLTASSCGSRQDPPSVGGCDVLVCEPRSDPPSVPPHTASSCGPRQDPPSEQNVPHSVSVSVVSVFTKCFP